jgi:branched-chain amino acid transport system substrate-binding protein
MTVSSKLGVWKLTLAAVTAATIAVTGFAIEKAKAAEDPIYLPLLVYRTGAYAPNGIPFANGQRDFLQMLMNRDGGINGVPLQWDECEMRYDTAMGVECYQRVKDGGAKGATVIVPLSTGITYAVMDVAGEDGIVVHSMGYGRAAASYGRVFKWTFTFPTTYWAQASAFIRYIAEQEGGKEALQGKKIGLIYHNSAYGREPIPTLERLSNDLGFEFVNYAVDHPGQEQSATWLSIRRDRPDWLLMWGWGVMNQVAITEAIRNNYPMERFLGVWWSGSEPDVRPAGTAAAGYKAGNFHGIGTDFGVLQDVLQYVYDGDEAAARANNWGEVLYNRGLVNNLYISEAMRTAMERYGNVTLGGEEVRWGMENLNLTAERIAEIGAEDLIQPIQITCEDHEGRGPVFIQQWNGTEWERISDWIDPMYDVVGPMYEEAALAYAEEHGIEVRDCDDD